MEFLFFSFFSRKEFSVFREMLRSDEHFIVDLSCMSDSLCSKCTDVRFMLSELTGSLLNNALLTSK